MYSDLPRKSVFKRRLGTIIQSTRTRWYQKGRDNRHAGIKRDEAMARKAFIVASNAFAGPPRTQIFLGGVFKTILKQLSYNLKGRAGTKKDETIDVLVLKRDETIARNALIVASRASRPEADLWFPSIISSASATPGVWYLRFGVQGSGFRVQGFRVQGSGCRVQGSGVGVLGSRVGVQGSGFRLQVSRVGVQGSGFRVQGSRVGIQGPGFRVEILGVQVPGFRFKVKGSGYMVQGGHVYCDPPPV